ncbi:MAG TPA: hypothetical protein VNT76_04960, partial [Candidatus Binatus sp.]|nr:hypothetical protein [Candidatus Binatus sp.]
MDQSKLPNTDPTILLLNEIEILLAQTRLMELYLKQAQATAANAAISSERQHQAELDLLRAALAAKEKNLAQLQASIVVPDPRHVKRVQEIEAELIDKQRVIDDRQAELASARSEIATLHDRIRELSAASQRTQAAAAISAAQSEKLQSDLEALGQELEKNRRDFDVHLGSSHELQHNLRAQLQQLHTEVAEKQRSAENVESELTAARSETSALQQRLDELHASRQQVETDGAAKLEQTRARFEAEIAELQTALA